MRSPDVRTSYMVFDNAAPGRYPFEVGGGARRDVDIREGLPSTVSLP